MGAAIFVDMANRLTGNEGAVHVVAYVVSGIGFLRAGVIMREEGNVRRSQRAASTLPQTRCMLLSAAAPMPLLPLQSGPRNPQAVPIPARRLLR